MKIDQFVEKSVLRFPGLIILTFIIIAIYAGTLLTGLTRNPTPYLLPPDHPSRINLEKLQQDYTGTKESILILMEAEKDIFTRGTLRRIKKLANAFENINIVTDKDRSQLLQSAESAPENLKRKIALLVEKKIDSDTWMLVDEISQELSLSEEDNKELNGALLCFSNKLSPIIKVTSLANTDNILGKNDELDISAIYEDVPEDKKELENIKKKVLSNELFHNTLVQDDPRYTSIIIEISTNEDNSDEKYMVYKKVVDIMENLIQGPEKYYISGMPVVTGALGKVMQQDTRRLFPIVLMIVVACLFFTFRRIKGVAAPLAVVILSLIITLGIQVLFNIPMNIVTTTLPVFILSIGVADGIHIFSEYRDNLEKGHDKIESVKLMLQHLTMPVIMTSVTTAVAFYAISLTKIVQLRHFGIFVAIGTIVAMFFSLFFIPALLVLLPEKTGAKEKKISNFEKTYTSLLISFTRTMVAKPKLITSIAVTILIIALFGTSKVVVDNNTAEYFLKDSTIYKATQKLNSVASGSSVINFLIQDNSGDDQPFKNPENLKAADDLVKFLQSRPVVGKALGLNDLIKRINYVMNNEDKKHNTIPGIQETNNQNSSAENKIAQLLLLYENGGGDVLTDLTDDNYTRLNIRAVVKSNSSRKMVELTDEVKTFAKQIFPPNLSLDVSGLAHVAVDATHEIVNGQIISLLVSLVLVFFMLLFTFRTLSYAFIAMVPLIMTISINFGIMGFFHIPLDIGTAIISSIVIGIGVDYGIHYISRFRKNREKGMDFTDALTNTVSHSGKAIVSNAVTVGLGFVALLFSVLTPLIIMGLMITITMLVSAFTTLALIPVFIVLLERSRAPQTQSSLEKQITLKPQHNL